MIDRVQCQRLQVAQNFKRFIDDEVLPGTGIVADTFWSGLDSLVHDLAPQNRALLTERVRLQNEVDTWHRAHPGPIRYMVAYKSFLKDVGYLAPQPDDVTVTTANVDTEITVQAGPQLVVPVMNARYALNTMHFTVQTRSAKKTVLKRDRAITRFVVI